jgi:hypothetical protein
MRRTADSGREAVAPRACAWYLKVNAFLMRSLAASRAWAHSLEVKDQQEFRVRDCLSQDSKIILL